MKKLFQLALGLCFTIAGDFGAKVLAQTDINTNNTSSCLENGGPQATQSIRLYYLQSASTIKSILDKIAETNNCLKGTVIEAQSDSEIILYGNRQQREELQRVIAILDLPREGVNMQMWGIRVSSDNPEQLAQAMGEVNQQIDRTQRLLQYTYISRLQNEEYDFDQLYLAVEDYKTKRRQQISNQE